MPPPHKQAELRLGPAKATSGSWQQEAEDRGGQQGAEDRGSQLEPEGQGSEPADLCRGPLEQGTQRSGTVAQRGGAAHQAPVGPACGSRALEARPARLAIKKRRVDASEGCTRQVGGDPCRRRLHVKQATAPGRRGGPPWITWLACEAAWGQIGGRYGARRVWACAGTGLLADSEKHVLWRWGQNLTEEGQLPNCIKIGCNALPGLYRMAWASMTISGCHPCTNMAEGLSMHKHG